jgi:hypothetical protein
MDMFLQIEQTVPFFLNSKVVLVSFEMSWWPPPAQKYLPDQPV